jgi:hypothetical protein
VPFAECFREASFRSELLEAVEVEFTGLDDEPVAVALADEAVLPDELPQSGYVAVEAVLGRRRRLLAPEAVDESIARHDPIRIQQQEREQRTLLRAAER